MILFEANAVAPLVNLPDAAAEETVQWEMVEIVATRGEKPHPCKNRKDGPPRLQRRNFKGATSKAKRTGAPKLAAYQMG